VKSIRIESLNIGLPEKEIFYGKEIFTGICKTPASGPVNLGNLGFEGDGVGDIKHHGGRDKAVCFYSIDHYFYWEKVLGIILPAAAFGENLTISGLLEEDVCIGDVFELGTAVVQVTQPRQPCKTLAARYGRVDMVKLVVDSGRTGFYCRVLQEGVVEKDSPFMLKERDTHEITVAFANRIFHRDRKDSEGIERVLEVPALSESWRRSFQELAEKCK
jgi:MOSC domain-containing protein YiiM